MIPVRLFKTKASATRAVRKAGLHGMAFEVRSKSGCFMPHFYCLTAEDREEVRRREFSAEVNVEFAKKD